MFRYVRLFIVYARMSLLLGVQHREELLLEAPIQLFWTGTTVVPLLAVFQFRESVAGWRLSEMLVVLGWFTMLRGVLEGAIIPSLAITLQRIRYGTFDLVLMKPADSQFLASAARLYPWRLVNIACAMAMFGYAFGSMGRAPSYLDVLLAAIMFTAACAVLYSIAIMLVSLSFSVVRLEAFSVFTLFDVARWPSGFFHGWIHFVLTFIIPVGLMTTYPADALLGRLKWSTFGWGVLGTSVFVTIARLLWQRAIQRYTSAGG